MIDPKDLVDRSFEARPATSLELAAVAQYVSILSMVVRRVMKTVEGKLGDDMTSMQETLKLLEASTDTMTRDLLDIEAKEGQDER